MNDYFTSETAQIHNGFGYYWDMFQPVIAAIAVFIVGWILALIIAGGTKKLLSLIGTNRHLSTATGKSPDFEKIISRFIFWFVLVIALIASLNVLNIYSVSGPFSAMITQVLVFVPNIIAAAVVAFVGWILARLVRASLSRVLSKTRLDEKLSSDVGVPLLSENIAEIIYWLILLLFLPIVLSILGLSGLLLPVQAMVADVVGYLPHLFISGVIIFAGYILAKIVRGIVQGLVNSVGLQTQAEKIGLFKSANVANVFGSLVFGLILITALIIAFEALGIDSISQPATSMLNEIMLAIPNLIAAGLILIIAYIVSRFVARLVEDILASTGVDDVPEKFELQRFLGSTKISHVIAVLIVFFTMLFAVVEAANRLGFDQISHLVAIFIAFGSNILLGALILAIGFWLANIVASVIQRGEYNSSRWLANLVRILIMGLVLAMGLRAMGIADSIVNLAFGLTLGAVAVAFALAFGLGGRQPAERVLTDLIDKAKAHGQQPNPLAKQPYGVLSDTDVATEHNSHLPHKP